MMENHRTIEIQIGIAMETTVAIVMDGDHKINRATEIAIAKRLATEIRTQKTEIEKRATMFELESRCIS